MSAKVVPLFPEVPLRTYACKYPGLKRKPPRTCPDCSLGYWAQGASWLHFLRTQRAPNTISSYRSSLRLVAKELQALGYTAETTLRADSIVMALAEMAQHVGPARFNVARVALKGYLKWRNDPNARAPLKVERVFEEIKKRATEDAPQDFDPKEVWRRLSKIDTRPLVNGFPRAARDVAFMALLFGTGLRPGEAAILRTSALNFKNKSVDVPRFKLSDPHRAATFAPALPLIRAWTRKHPAAKARRRFRATDKLFFGPEGAQLTRGEWAELPKLYGMRDGWKSGHGRPFTLRHLRPTFGSWMLNSKGGDLGKVQRQLGHKSPETTARYYARYDYKKLQEVVGGMKL